MHPITLRPARPFGARTPSVSFRIPFLIPFVAFAALATAGCSAAPRVTYVPDSGRLLARHPSSDVAVLLDRTPDRAFMVTGQFSAHTGSSVRSIELIRARAAAAGLDGVYWIDCDTHFNGECTAKGFIYQDQNVSAPYGGSALAEQ